MFKILGAVFRGAFRRVDKFATEISKAIDNGDEVAKRENIGNLFSYIGTRFGIWFVGFLLAGALHLGALYLKLTVIISMFGIVLAFSPDEQGPDDGDGSDDDVIDQEDFDIAVADAEANYPDVRSLTYNSILDTMLDPANNVRIIPPRNEYALGRSVDDGVMTFHMVGLTAIYQFEVNYEGTLGPSAVNNIVDELQRNITKNASRYPFIIKENRPPVVLDVKPCGNFSCLKSRFSLRLHRN